MALDRLIDAVKRTGNPTVAGLDPKLEYLPPSMVSRHLQEFRAKNYELQNRQGVNPYDEMIELTREYDELLHNSVVSDFLQAEQQICKLLQRVFDSIAEGLEFDYINE